MASGSPGSHPERITDEQLAAFLLVSPFFSCRGTNRCRWCSGWERLPAMDEAYGEVAGHKADCAYVALTTALQQRREQERVGTAAETSNTLLDTCPTCRTVIGFKPWQPPSPEPPAPQADPARGGNWYLGWPEPPAGAQTAQDVEALIAAIERHDFECVGGPLSLCQPWIDLKARLSPEATR